MLFATVSRGRKRGTRLLPHRFKDDRYHVQLGKEGPYIHGHRLPRHPFLPGERLFASHERQSREPHSQSDKPSIHSWMEQDIPRSIFYPPLSVEHLLKSFLSERAAAFPCV